ncbi:MAG: hypothetical protein ACR2G2_13240 [Pseudonocardia sp.]
MTTLMARVRGFYGANPLHLLALLGCFALAGYAALQVGSEPSWPIVALWFLGAVIAHDLVLFPLYALADRSLTGGLRALRPARGGAAPRVSPVNHVRVPILGAGLLLLLFFPGVIRQGGKTYLDATGQTQQPYLARWLLITAAMFLISAVIYGARLARAHRNPHHTSTAGDTAPGGGSPEGGADPGPITSAPRKPARSPDQRQT